MVDDESQMILAQIQPTDVVIALDIHGTLGSTQDFHKAIEASFNQGKHCVFVIGGSHGYNQAVRQRANIRFSMSRMTFPHQWYEPYSLNKSIALIPFTRIFLMINEGLLVFSFSF